MFWQIPGHVAHEPLKVLAAQSAPELLLGCHVSCRKVAVLRPALIDILCILIHPNLSHPLQVLNAKRINRELTFHQQPPLRMYISFLYAIGNGPPSPCKEDDSDGSVVSTGGRICPLKTQESTLRITKEELVGALSVVNVLLNPQEQVIPE